MPLFFKRPFLLFLIFLLFPLQFNNAQDASELYNESTSAFKNKDFTKAEIIINKAIQADSTRSEFYILRARISMEQEKYDNTIKDCYYALKLTPGNPEVYMLRGELCMITKSYGGAILFFGKAINGFSDNDMLCKAFVNRGNAYFNLDKFSEAQNDFMSAYDINPNSTDVLFPLAKTYIKLNHKKEALYTLDKIIKEDAQYAPAYQLLGSIETGNEEFEKAIDAYNTYLTLNPKSGETYISLAGIYVKMKKYDLALLNANKALSLLPEEPEIFKIKSEVYFEQGLKEEGCNNLFRAFQLGYIEKYGYGALDEYISKCEDH